MHVITERWGFHFIFVPGELHVQNHDLASVNMRLRGERSRAVPSVRQITGLRALGSVRGAGNPNAVTLHMRLKRRALHPEQGGCSLRPATIQLVCLRAEPKSARARPPRARRASSQYPTSNGMLFPPFAMQALGRGKRSTGSIGRSETSA